MVDRIEGFHPSILFFQRKPHASQAGHMSMEGFDFHSDANLQALDLRRNSQGNAVFRIDVRRVQWSMPNGNFGAEI